MVCKRILSPDDTSVTSDFTSSRKSPFTRLSARRSLAKLMDENATTPKRSALKLKTPDNTTLKTKFNFKNATLNISTNITIKSASKEVSNILNSPTRQEQERSINDMSQLYLLRDIDETESDIDITKYNDESLDVSKMHLDNYSNENESLGEREKILIIPFLDKFILF